MGNIEKYINQDINNPEFLFHGSPLKLDKIEPRLSHDSYNQEINIDEAVFLFPSFLKSIPYAFKDKIKENNDTYDFEILNRDIIPIMTIRNVEHVDENITGYVYVFKKDDSMIKDDGELLQYKCYKELNPIDVMEVKLKDFLKYITVKERISTDNFIFDEFDFDKKSHIELETNLIKSEGSELVSRDIDKFIRRNIEFHKENPITNTYIVSYKDVYIGLAFVNYHPEEVRDNKVLEEEIEIGLGLLPINRGKHLGSMIENELSKKLLDLYPKFDKIVGIINKDNIISKKAVLSAGFEQVDEEEYHFKRK